MRSITPELTNELLNHYKDANKVAASEAFPINTFRELVEVAAKLSYKNKDNLLFFRGQNNDFLNKAGSSTFYPSIYRGDYLPIRELTNRFDILEGACKALVDLFTEKKIDGYKELKKRKYVQWSVLQHYEVCSTPLLDFTHSLRVACSFATLGNTNDFAYVYMFGFPYLTNRISINSEQDIINIRLLSICPPNALRPYFQEGYLAGTDEITTNFDSKNELDFNNRLVAKFKINNSKVFWGNDFHEIPEASLYPKQDEILELCQEIKSIVERELKTGDLGEFLKLWAELEDVMVTTSRNESKRFLSVREAARLLYESKKIDKGQAFIIDRLRIFRNLLVHTPKKISQQELQDYTQSLIVILAELKIKL